MNIHPDDELASNLIRRDGVYSVNDLMVFRKFLREGDTFIDAGANIGWQTLFGASLVGTSGKVYSFEPNPKNLKVLRDNVNLNKFSQTVVSECALSNFCGHAGMYLSQDNFGDNLLATKDLSGTHKEKAYVSCITLDMFLAEHEIDGSRINLIKMDIQGSEALALAGMQRLIESHLPPIILEYAPNHLKWCGSSPFDILSFIDRYGYIPYQIREEKNLTPNTVLEKVTLQDIINATNYLFSLPVAQGVDFLLVQPKHLNLL